MNVLIHTVAGAEVGYGHVVRCSRLASALARRRCRVFAWPGRPTLATGYLYDHGPVLVKDVPYRAEVGILDTMVYDQNAVDQLRRCVDRLVVIVGAGQNLTPKVLDACDLLVYQTGWEMPVVGSHEGRPGEEISGPGYLILDPAYAVPPFVQRDRGALVVFGAGIPWSYSLEVAQEFVRVGVRGTLVVPPYNAESYEYPISPLVTTIRAPTSLRALQHIHSVQVGSFGMSTYEAIAAGCWPVVVGRSADHVASADLLASLSSCHSMGLWEWVTPESVVINAREYMESHPSFGVRIDGHGVNRVADRILSADYLPAFASEAE